jgi:hypothetical protein
MTLLAAIVAVALATDLTPKPPSAAGPEHAKVETRCGACHTAEGWDRVTFDHARTGFALEGGHRTGPCRGCHVESDFKRAVPRACVACHRDAHAGRMGTRCHDCHDAVAWSEPTFGPEAHRRTNFALDGRHAVIPCEECHGDRRDRSFSRPTRRCVDCHEADLQRAAVTAFDHGVFGNAQDCRRCHGAWRFSPGYFSGHDACFPIRSGTHSGIRCLSCHPSLSVTDFNTGTCTTAVPAACTRCHPCASVQANHAGVGGFTCTNLDALCYGCHPGGSVGGG